MNLEQQVVSLDLAKRLKELGVKQESYFWWIEHGQPTHLIAYKDRAIFQDKTWLRAATAAFTVAELGEMLPYNIQIKGESINQFFGTQKNVEREWAYFYGNGHGAWRVAFSWLETEADARAKMLIYLLENKLITV